MLLSVLDVSLDVVCIPSTQRSYAHFLCSCLCPNHRNSSTTSSSSGVASRRWPQVLAPLRVNPALLAVAEGRMFHPAAVSQWIPLNPEKLCYFGPSSQQLYSCYIFGPIGRRSSTVFGILIPCWYSYSYHNNRYIFGPRDMTCLRSSRRALQPTKTKYPVGNHPNILMPYEIIPRYGIGELDRSCQWHNAYTWELLRLYLGNFFVAIFWKCTLMRFFFACEVA